MSFTGNKGMKIMQILIFSSSLSLQWILRLTQCATKSGTNLVCIDNLQDLGTPFVTLGTKYLDTLKSRFLQIPFVKVVNFLHHTRSYKMVLRLTFPVNAQY